MLRFLSEAGPVIFPVILLGVVVAFLTAWNALTLMLRGAENPARRRSSIDAILFWGSVAAVLGFLGQWIGILKITKVIAREGVVSPPMVVLGLSESLLTTVTGMMVLAVAAFLWFILRVGLWTRERRA
jgi:biopolymer transport protein ExbB/TolQ